MITKARYRGETIKKNVLSDAGVHFAAGGQRTKTPVQKKNTLGNKQNELNLKIICKRHRHRHGYDYIEMI